MANETNRQLDATEIIRAITKLRQRIKERFPDRNLENVCASLLAIAKDSKEKIEWINTPNILLRIVVGLIVLAAILAFIASLRIVDISMSEMHLLDVVTLLEAGMNDLVLIGAALFFLFTIESRIKRNRSIKALNEIRSIAHVIDMHQLTKDPSVVNRSQPTKSSPERTLDAYQLCRYLDYCSEMFSLSGKVAALYAQHQPDGVVLATVNEIEELTTGFSRKVWQKIAMLNMLEFDD